MSDGDDFDVQDEGRGLILQAAQKSVDATEHSAGGVVTGYILVVESMGGDGEANITWISGNGMPTAKGQGGLPRWRMAGMLMDVATQVQAAIWRYRLRGED